MIKYPAVEPRVNSREPILIENMTINNSQEDENEQLEPH